MKGYIFFKIDSIYVLQIKNPKIRLYRMNPRSEKMLIIFEVYSYFKELFKKNRQIAYYQNIKIKIIRLSLNRDHNREKD